MESTPLRVDGARSRDRGAVRRARGPVLALSLLCLGAVLAACAAPARVHRRSPAHAAAHATATAPATTAPSTVPPPTTVPSSPATRPAASRPASVVAGGHVAAGSRLGVGGCRLFPDDQAFHADVRTLPVTAGSAATIRAEGGSGVQLRAGFSSRVVEGSRTGTPINVVDPATSRPTDFVSALWSSGWSTATDVPMPADPRFEGWPGRAWDKHLLLVDQADCTSRELIDVMPPGENLTAGGRWYADAVATIDLGSDRAPDHAVVAAKLSLLSGLVRYDEVASGDVGHVLTMSLPVIRSGAPVWPAQGSDGRSDDPAAPPMGSWFRLRPDVDLSGLGPEARTVARALQVYGAVAVDSGPHLAIDGEPDVRWDDADLDSLRTLSASDLQVIDPTPMRVSSDPADLRIR